MANKKKHRRQKGGVMGMSHIPFSQRLQMQRAGEIGWSREHAARVTMWCFCVALHEKEGIAYKRLMRFAQRFTEIDEEFYDQEIEVSMEHARRRLASMGIEISGELMAAPPGSRARASGRRS